MKRASRLALATLALGLATASQASAQVYVYGFSGGSSITYGQCCGPNLLDLNGGAGGGGVTLDVVSTGWYDQTGFHGLGNTNYIVSEGLGGPGSAHRNWSFFDIPVLNGGITSAVFRAQTATVQQQGGNANLVSFFDVFVDVIDLETNNGGLGAFTDLGTGALYGSRSYTTADNGQLRDITLSAAAIADLNAAQGARWGIGGRLDGLQDVTPVPEPGTWALMATGLVGMAGVVRRRRKTA